MQTTVAALQHEAAQHMWWTFLFSFSNVAWRGCPLVIGWTTSDETELMNGLHLVNQRKETQASYAKTRTEVTAVYVTPDPVRRKQARLLEGMLSEVDQEEAA